MTDGGEVSLVLSIFELNFFLCQPIPIDRANQLLIFLQQSLSEFLGFLVVHCVFLSLPKPSWFRNRDMGVYASGSPCQPALLRAISFGFASELKKLPNRLQ